MSRLRSVLRRIAPAWVASPLRRAIQAACLAAFLVLFFYVCCPYTARPAAVWGGWLPTDVDATSGRITLSADEPAGNPISVDQVLHVVDPGASPPAYLGAFRVIDSADGRLVLEPEASMTPERLERLSASFGPWSLRDDEPGSWPSHYARDREGKEILPAELFLRLDPLASLSAAVAARAWVGSLVGAGVILLVCLVVPRGFCGYVCPMGTLIDLFDWAVGRRVSRTGLKPRGWWATTKYWLLLGVLVAALGGVLISGFLAAIPVLTRGIAFLLAPIQTGWIRGWHQVPPLGAGQIFSIVLFLAVFALGFLGPRFWCKYVCPTGAVFSVANLLRLAERKVDSRCTACGRCVEHCPFGAIDEDFSTRTADCAFCRTCGGVCPTEAIRYGWKKVSGTVSAEPGTNRGLSAGLPEKRFLTPFPGRRGLLRAAVGAVVGIIGGVAAAALIRRSDRKAASGAPMPVRPPGTLPEPDFLALCVRCGECYRACPNDALQPLGISAGLDGLWTPHLAADWSGCEPSCNHCGHVCPTGAIRPLPLEEKRVARIGLAVIDRRTCLPHAGHSACRLCVDECSRAGYHAIEFERVGTELDEKGRPIEDSGLLAPVVIPSKCVGCGLCQTRCRAINAAEKGLLAQSAIIVQAGEGKEDRLTSGSYVALRQQEETQRKAERRRLLDRTKGSETYLPDWIK